MQYTLIVLSVIVRLHLVTPNYLLTRKNNKIEDNGGPGEPLFLTPYIESGHIKEGQEAAKVVGLSDDVKSYSGYLTVNKKFNSNTFFWYFVSETDPENAPVLVWLQGGPGGTSLVGLFVENGPFSVVGDKLVQREHRWNKKINLIYIDNPVGVGYSYTLSEDGYAKNQTDVGRDLYSAIVQFLKLFPHLQTNKFFISGTSYAGKYIPALGYAIHEKNSDPENDFKINLQGLLIGNGFTDPPNMLLYSDYLYQVGLFDHNERKTMAENEDESRQLISQGYFSEAFDKITQIWEDIKKITGLGNAVLYNFINVSNEVWTNSTTKFVTSNKFRRSVHVGDAQWNGIMNFNVSTYLKEDMGKSVIDWVVELLKHYKVTFFYGQLDIICAYPLMENALLRMHWDGEDEFYKAKKHRWFVDDDVAGYYKEAKNLTFVLVRNAGHSVPFDQPKWAENLLHRLIFDGHL